MVGERSIDSIRSERGPVESKRTIAMASDHAGIMLKAALKDYIIGLGHDVVDLGPHTSDSVDYPDYAYKLADSIASSQADLGVAICGSGIGISIGMNRHPAIRCALVTNGLMARLSRQHNDANVLALGDRLTGVDVAKDCVKEFLQTPFEGGRHQRRVDKLSQPTLNC